MATTLHSQDVADYLLANVDEESGDGISNLKLQKLVYYSQGLYLAMQGEPLFDEPIEAWDRGPVVPALYASYKHYHHRPIEPPQQFVAGDYPPEIREILDAVQTVYGQFSAWKLRDMTLGEPPWRSTPRNEPISLDSLAAFFSQIVDAGRDDRAIVGQPVWPSNSFQHQRRKEIMRRVPDHLRLRTAMARIAPKKVSSSSQD